MEQPKNNIKLVSKKNSRVILPNILTLIGVCIGLTSIKFSFDGNFQLSVQDNAVIIFSYVGYLSQAVSASSTMEIVMQEDIANLEEVIVTGYGGVRKKDLVSSISQIKGDAIENKPVSRVDN